MEFLNPKISLKFPLSAVVHEKPKVKPKIKQSIIDNFEIAYANNCD